MRILAVDTSSERGSVCIAQSGEILGEVRLSSSIQHSERLFGSIEFLFRYLPFQLKDIELFVSARGPGSFTGLRVGLAATEGFAAAFRARKAGVSTLEAVAWNAGATDALIAPTIDARRGEVYGASYRRVGNELIEQHAPVVLKPAAWLASLPKEPIVFCGDGAISYREMIEEHSAWNVRDIDLYLARAMAEIAWSHGGGPMQPLYVRKTDAEIARERLHESIGSPHP